MLMIARRVPAGLSWMRQIKSFCQSNNLSFLPTNFPSGTKQTVSMNSIISAAQTASSAALRLRLGILRPYLPRSRIRDLFDLWTGRARHRARSRRGAQLAQKIGDVLGHRPMLGSEGAGLLAIILLLSSQLPQPKFLPFRDRGLRHEAAEDDLASSIEPVTGQRLDHLPPNALLELIKIVRRLRTTPPRKHRHNGERDCRFTTAGHGRFPSHWKRHGSRVGYKPQGGASPEFVLLETEQVMAIEGQRESSLAQNVPADQDVKTKAVACEFAALHQMRTELPGNRPGRSLLRPEQKTDQESILIHDVLTRGSAHTGPSARLQPDRLHDVPGDARHRRSGVY